jgi:hypothetical protein
LPIPHPGGMPETVFIWDTGRLELNSVLRHRDAIKTAGECPRPSLCWLAQLDLVSFCVFFSINVCKFVVYFFTGWVSRNT